MSVAPTRMNFDSEEKWGRLVLSINQTEEIH
jgi:hypothetical protein